jgi:hypothetical protein
MGRIYRKNAQKDGKHHRKKLVWRPMYRPDDNTVYPIYYHYACPGMLHIQLL